MSCEQSGGTACWLVRTAVSVAQPVMRTVPRNAHYELLVVDLITLEDLSAKHMKHETGRVFPSGAPASLPVSNTIVARWCSR
jgi:hypothetical protein